MIALLAILSILGPTAEANVHQTLETALVSSDGLPMLEKESIYINALRSQISENAPTRRTDRWLKRLLTDSINTINALHPRDSNQDLNAVILEHSIQLVVKASKLNEQIIGEERRSDLQYMTIANERAVKSIEWIESAFDSRTQVVLIRLALSQWIEVATLDDNAEANLYLDEVQLARTMIQSSTAPLNAAGLRALRRSFKAWVEKL